MKFKIIVTLFLVTGIGLTAKVTIVTMIFYPSHMGRATGLGGSKRVGEARGNLSKIIVTTVTIVTFFCNMPLN